MEDLGSLWNFQEDFDELKLKLQFTTMELESVRMEANEQIRRYKDDLTSLANLLNLANQERDEAKDQFHKLANKLMASPTTTTTTPNELLQQPSIFPQFQSENLLLIAAAKANSSITESNSLSDSYYHHSHGSSPVDSSMFDPVTSPDFSSIHVADCSSGFAATSLIDDLAKGKTLPRKGKLLQAVMEAGPLLQTLLVAGPLPQWRNPPPLHTYKIPPVSIKACDSKSGNQDPNPTIVLKQLNSSSLSSSAYPRMTRGTRRSCSAAMLDFAASGPAASGMNITAGKRQRLQ